MYVVLSLRRIKIENWTIYQEKWRKLHIFGDVKTAAACLVCTLIPGQLHCFLLPTWLCRHEGGDLMVIVTFKWPGHDLHSRDFQQLYSVMC